MPRESDATTESKLALVGRLSQFSIKVGLCIPTTVRTRFAYYLEPYPLTFIHISGVL